MSTRKGMDFHAEEDALDGGLEFHDEVERIGEWDDLLDDGRIKYRSLGQAYQAYRRQREREDEA